MPIVGAEALARYNQYLLCISHSINIIISVFFFLYSISWREQETKG